MLVTADSAISPSTPQDSAPANGFGRHDSITNGSQSQNNEESGLSARQINVLKRKRKLEAQKAALRKSGFGDMSIAYEQQSGLRRSLRTPRFAPHFEVSLFPFERVRERIVKLPSVKD